VLLQDYRDLRGRFDKLVSIEMIEAVGWQYFDEFFRRILLLYLAYCEAVFAERRIGDVQLLLAKPGYPSSLRVSSSDSRAMSATVS
jgi:hypothetical protein